MNARKSVFMSVLLWVGIGTYLALMPPAEASPSAQEEGAIQEVILFSVYDNYRINPALKTGWGFGSVVKTPKETLLFDTGGNAEILLFNMEKMHVDPQAVDTVIISHIHADHAGGLKGFLEKNHDVTVFIPSSFPDTIRQMIISQGADFVDVSGPHQISDSIFSTGELYGPPNEQSLVVRSRKGLIVMTGCGHPGIMRIVKKAQEICPKKEVYLTVGGFHHPPMEVVKGLRQLGVKKVAPSHCTGDHVIQAFRREYREGFITYGVGQIIEVKE
jgi:7,8-dihydropterin-6-yl-methyl-4-(beta-D-ribofuranosyl)aminobenzene 5'-phosphate synthase